MIQISGSIDKSKNHNVYMLFGWEAIQARPNLDPYTSTLRMNDETQQVYTSDVHIKHHIRRGMKYFIRSKAPGEYEGYNDVDNEGIVFYEKTDDFGRGRSFDNKITSLREAHGISNKDKHEKDALNYCVDTPLFGYVHAVANEHFNVTNAANTLFRPSTFHSCSILPLGRNNAFTAEGREASGSATVDSLEYGFFLALWEINLNMLKVNAAEHKVIEWDDVEGYKKWLELLSNGMWEAYTEARYPSFTQRPQFAQFLIGWHPKPEGLEFDSPHTLINAINEKNVKDHDTAVKELQSVLPDFLGKWNCTKETVFMEEKANNFPVTLV